ncbi:MAG: LptF/LptG family permease [Deltaproteobacteria bacterium]|nr:LptF/LptG family permease [Deltaproteobacteria bacterium]MCL5277702.1 LptF/LptG family permease [Deltaproteobacteria bacterium]
MKILNRYLLREFVWTYITSISVLSGIYIIVNIFESLKDLLSLQPSVYSVVVFYLTQVPGIVYQTVPMAALLTVIIIYTVMSGHNEIGSLLSTGISPATMVKPLMGMVLLLSLLHFSLGEYVVPRANIKNDIVDSRIHHTRSRFYKDSMVSNIWFKANDEIIKAGLFVPWLDTVKDITVYGFSGHNGLLRSRMDVATAKWDGDRWALSDVYVRDFHNGYQTGYRFSGSAEMSLPITIADFKHTGKTPGEMDYSELSAYIKRLKQEGYTYAPYDVDLNNKLSYPFSSLFVILLVIPFSMKKRKTSGMMLAFGISLAVGFSYWILMALSLSMGNSDILDPVAAAWTPNVVTFLIALVINGLTKW